MTVYGHVTLSTTIVAIGGLIATVLGYSMYERWLPVFIMGIVIGSVFPDIDEPRSFIGRKTRLISDFLAVIFKHRGFTHTLLCSLIVMALLLYITHEYMKGEDMWYAASIGFGIGWFLHTPGDMLTKEGGIAVFWPISKKRFFLLPKGLRFQTNGVGEIFFTIFLFVIQLFVYWNFVNLYKLQGFYI